MSDKPWKRFEREAAEAIGGKRFWANAGEAIDCESEHFVLQCKHVKAMSLAALTKLADQVHAQGKTRGKVGLVAVKLRSGRGTRTPMLLVMHEDALPLLLQGPGSMSGNDMGSGTGVPNSRQSAAPGSESEGAHRPPADDDVPASARCGGKPVGKKGAARASGDLPERASSVAGDAHAAPVCPRCKGKGRVWFMGHSGESLLDVCPDCDGEGK